MISLLLNIGSVSAGLAGLFDTSSTGSFVEPSYSPMYASAFQQPAYGKSWSGLDTSSTSAFIQQPAYGKSFSALDTSSTSTFIQQPMYGKTSAFIQQPTFSALDTSSTSALIQRPMYGKSFSALDTSSMSAFVQQPVYGKSFSALDTSSTSAFVQQPVYGKSFSALDTSSASAFVQQPVYGKSWSSLDTSSASAFIQQPVYGQTSAFLRQPRYGKSFSALDTSSTSAFIQQPRYGKSFPALDTSSTSAFITQPSGYGYQAMESASATNPYNVNMLNHNIAPLTVQASKVMPVKQIIGGEQHVVDNNLQLHVNHEADKTVLTKRLIHHSPVLHKTIRTHQIAQDVVHDKQVHHMNVVEDRVKQVPGQEYIGTKQQVDHTTANPPAASIAQPLAMKKLNLYKKF